MFYQWLLIFFSGGRLPEPISIDKSIQDQTSFWKYFRIFLWDKSDLFPKPSCNIHTVSYHHIRIDYHIQGDGNEDADEGDVKETYIGLTATLEVVTSAGRGL